MLWCVLNVFFINLFGSDMHRDSVMSLIKKKNNNTSRALGVSSVK